MQCINDLGSSIDGESFETLSTSHRHDIWDTSRLKLRIAVSYCGDYFTDSLKLVRSATYRGGSCLKRTAAAVVCCLPARCGWQSEQLTLPAPRTRPTAGLPKAARVAAIFLRFIGRFLFVCFQLAAAASRALPPADILYTRPVSAAAAASVRGSASCCCCC